MVSLTHLEKKRLSPRQKHQRPPASFLAVIFAQSITRYLLHLPPLLSSIISLSQLLPFSLTQSTSPRANTFHHAGVASSPVRYPAIATRPAAYFGLGFTGPFILKAIFYRVRYRVVIRSRHCHVHPAALAATSPQSLISNAASFQRRNQQPTSSPPPCVEIMDMVSWIP